MANRALALLLADPRYAAAATAGQDSGRLLLLPLLLHVAERQHAQTGDPSLPLDHAHLGALTTDVPVRVAHLARCLELALGAGLADDAGDGRVLLVHGPQPRRRKPSDSPERVLARVHAHRDRTRNAVTPPVTPPEASGCNAVTPAVTPLDGEGESQGVTAGVTVAEGGVTPPTLRVERGGVTASGAEGVTGGVTAGGVGGAVAKNKSSSTGKNSPPTSPPSPPRGVTPPVTPPWSARVFDLHREATGGEPTKGSLKALKPLVARYGEPAFLKRIEEFYASPARRFGLRYFAENYGTFDQSTAASPLAPVASSVDAVIATLEARRARAGGANG